jgi:hypothetical protein
MIRCPFCLADNRSGCSYCCLCGIFIGEEDLRIDIADALLDYAKQATAEGKPFDAEIWTKAADIARNFVTRRT